MARVWHWRTGMRRGRRAPILKMPRRRADKLLLQFVRGSFRFLSVFPHAVSAIWAERLFLTPLRQRRTRREREILAHGRFRALATGNGRLATWTWGEGPAVLLVHGWGGHAGRLSRFVSPLVDAGFSVIAFDAPAHGRSNGQFCSLADFVGAVLAVAKESGPLAGLVGHSLGAAACVLAIRQGLEARAVVLLAPLADPEEYAGKFANICRMPAPVRDSMKIRVAARQGVAWESLRLLEPRPATGAPLLVFHDRGDLKVPLRDGRAIAEAWPRADLVATRGLGHHKILRAPEVVCGAVEFFRRSLPAPRRARAAGGRIA